MWGNIIVAVFVFLCIHNGLGRTHQGEAVHIGKVPYIVYLKGADLSCAGSIINSNIILTSALCVTELLISNLSIVAGTAHPLNTGQHIPVEKILTHENFSRYTLEHDLAILKLSGNLNLTNVTKTIKLSTERPVIGELATFFGWGFDLIFNKVTDLQGYNYTLMDNEECSKKYGSPGAVKQNMLCAGPDSSDLCSGYRGGPFIYNEKLAGIFSWINPCSLRGYPAVYTDISSHYSWILEHILHF